MNDHRRWAIVLGVAGTIVLLIGCVDPLEGFPLILIGGALAAASAWVAGSRWLKLLGWGLGLAAVGCAVMLLLTAWGGIGGDSGHSLAWGWTLAPYPVGGLMMLAGCALLLKQLLGGRGRGPAGHASSAG